MASGHAESLCPGFTVRGAHADDIWVRPACVSGERAPAARYDCTVLVDM